MKLSLVAILAFATAAADAGEVLLHSGPTVSTPISSLSSPERTAEELVFEKQFFIDSAALGRLPAPHSPSSDVAISAERAAELAKKTVDAGGGPGILKVGKQELLTTTAGSKPVEYHFIEMTVNGSTEHRIVLMDGSVIKPRLKRIAAANPKSPGSSK